MTVSSNTLKPQRRVSLHVYLAFGILVALSLVVKFPVWGLRPQVFSDSPGYLVPAVSLLEGRGYGVQENGFRSPIYPVFLDLILSPLDRTHLSACRDAHRPVCIDQAAKTTDGALSLRLVVVGQVILGFLTTGLLFSLGWKLTKNALMAFLLGAGYALNLSTAYWEISLLTETLTTFLLTLAVYLTLRAGALTPPAALLLGLVLAALALCHQLFLGYWIVPAAFLLFSAFRGHRRTGLLRIAPIALIPIISIGLWSMYNYVVNGVFTPSILSGFVLIQMVGPVVQNAPEGYDGITQPYVGFRDAMIAETGTHSGAIYRAWPTMMDWTGLTFSQISYKLTTLSVYLIIHYPQTYLDVARQGWSRFWDFQIFHYDPIPPAVPAWAVWLTNRAVQDLLNVIFGLSPLVLGAILLLTRGQREHSSRSIPTAAILLMISTVWFATVIVTLSSFGDNVRYRSYTLPMQYGTIILVLWAIWQVLPRPADRQTVALEIR